MTTASVDEVAATGAMRRMRAPGWIARLAREPLLRFLLIGAVLFAAISLARALERPKVTLDAQELNQLVSYWEMQSGRPPNKAELAAIIQDRVDEELLAREARRLGLDRDDLIIRRRLAQKMAFASEDTAAFAEPDAAALRAYYQAHIDRYQVPSRVALSQVFFSGDRGGADAKSAAEAALAAKRAGRAADGDPFLLPLAYADVSTTELTRDYGPDFVRAVQAAPLGAWIGPLASPYGMHLIKVERRIVSEVQPFDQVRADVRDAYLADQRQAKSAAYLQALRQRYRVEVAGVAP